MTDMKHDSHSHDVVEDGQSHGCGCSASVPQAPVKAASGCCGPAASADKDSCCDAAPEVPAQSGSDCCGGCIPQEEPESSCGSSACASPMPLGSAASTLQLRIPDMDCPSEEAMIRRALDGMAVGSLRFDLGGRTLTLQADDSAHAAIVQAIEAAGLKTERVAQGGLLLRVLSRDSLAQTLGLQPRRLDRLLDSVPGAFCGLHRHRAC